MLLKDISIQTE